MITFSAQGSSDRRTPPVGSSPTLPTLPSDVHPQRPSVTWRNTSRVPGVTRNSGWQTVNAEIVRTRPVPDRP